ncbi:unnamed protein product [Mucor fragilis]
MKNQQAKQQEAAAAKARAAANSGDEAVEGQQQEQQQAPAAQGQQAQSEDEESQGQQDQGDDQSDDNQEQEQQASEEEDDDEEESEEEEESDDDDELEELYRLMVGKKINKAGLVVDKKSGAVLGKIAEGKLKRMTGKKVRDNGEVYNDKGKLIGRVEPVQEDSDDDDDSDDSEADDNTEAATKKAEEDAPAADAIKDDDTPENDARSAAEDTANDAQDKAEDVTGEASEAVDGLKKGAEDAADDAQDKADDGKQATEDIADDTQDKADDVKQTAEDAASDAEDNTEEAKESTRDIASDAEDNADDAKKATEDVAEDVAEDAKDTKKDTEDAVSDAEDTVKDTKERDVKQDAEDAEDAVEDLEVGDKDDKASDASDASDEEEKPFNPYDLVDEDSPEVRKSGKVVDMEDNVVGTVDKGMAPKLAGFKVDKDGNVVNHEGHIVAKAELYKTEEEEPEQEEEDQDKPFNPNENVNEDSPEVRKSGKIVDMEDNVVGTIDKEQAPKFAGFKVDKDGNVINHEGHIVAKANLYETEEEEKPFNPNEMVNADSPEVRKSGKVFDMDDNLVGHVDKRVAAKLAGMKVDETGNVINDEGHIVGKAEMIKPEPEEEEEEEPKEDEKKPFNPNEAVDEDSPEVRKSGKVVDMEDNIVGHVDKKLAPKLAGFKVDSDGNVINNEGHIVARAEMIPAEKEEEKRFNPNEAVDEDSPEVKKSGKILDMDDNLVGHIDKKLAAKMVGFKVDPQGNVINNEGHIVATAEMIKEPEQEEEKKPFNPNENVNEDSPEVKRSGKILDMDDEVVGHIDKKLAAKLAGFKVDPQGNVIDNDGHIVATAEMIQEPEEEKKPFNPNDAVDENSPEVKRSGKVVDMDDNIVGSVDKRLAPKLAGFKVDDDGNVIDNEGHIVAKAEMIPDEEEEDPNKPFNPNTMVDEHSPRVRKSGKVVDEDDNIVGEVDKSSAHKLAGFPVDDDGNIIDNDGHIVGKAKMHGKKSEEQLKEEAEEEEYRKIADQMSQSIQTSLDKIKPILKNITDTIDDEEAKPQKERDEQKLVDTVKPLIEQGSAILEECNGAIRGLDPSGRIAKQAQAKTSARKATPEEYHLADLLAQLSGEVSTTIDKAKKKVRNMPHAKKELSPLWNILQSPLLQILSAVGLLLTGVLGLVGNILNGLGLGSIINGLLGGIGLNKILEGFGLGDALKLGRKK